MGRSPCCDKVGLKKGPWTPEEDQKLLAYIEEHGHGSWRALPAKAGLQRCGKSCRLRWTNYLRPDIKRGKFSVQEEQTIIQLHALLGNRWSAIATHLPKRTDNEIKNYWNTHLKKRLAKMGIDPVTHKSKNDALLSSDGQTKNTANLSHMAQWESARLEAEARLVRESKIRSHSFQQQHANAGLMISSSSTTASNQLLGKSDTAPMQSHSLDVLRVWNQVNGNGCLADLESPTSTLTFSENNVLPIMITGFGESSKTMIEFVGTSGSSDAGTVKEEGEQDWKSYENSIHLAEYKDTLEHSMSFTSGLHDLTMSLEGTWSSESLRANTDGHVRLENLMTDEGFTDLLLNSSDEQSVSDTGGSGSDYCEDNKNYWNSILNFVNSPSDSPKF